MNHLQLLLDKFEPIRVENKQLSKAHNFNIFSILRKKSDEVNLHSRFIAELLNPQGSHGLGDIFLKLFLEVIRKREFNLGGVKVYREKHKIDLLIEGNSGWIVIENKIYAEDQNTQLERYYETALKIIKDINKIDIFYLSLFGKEPSFQSLGNLPPNLINLISYNKDVLEWIDKCIEKAAMKPELREVLVQYSRIVKELTGNMRSEELKNQVIDVLSKGDNILRANEIVQYWTDVKWHVQERFWEKLEGKIAHELVGVVINVDDYHFRKNQDFKNSVKSRNNLKAWYGIHFPVATFDNYKIHVCIEGCQTPRDENTVYYGLTLFRDSVRELSIDRTKTPKFLVDLVDKEENFGEKWLLINEFQEKIDFVGFNDEKTVELINEQKMNNLIESLWSQISTLLEKIRRSELVEEDILKQ